VIRRVVEADVAHLTVFGLLAHEVVRRLEHRGDDRAFDLGQRPAGMQQVRLERAVDAIVPGKG